MTQSFQIHSADDMICRFCGTAMRLFGIERDPDSEGMMLRSYECPHCKSLQTSTALPTDQDRNGFSNPIFRLASENGFDDAALALLGSAFDAAWRIVESSDSPPAEDSRERLAKSIIAQGMMGERDEARIVELALASLMAQTCGPDLSETKPAQKPACV